MKNKNFLIKIIIALMILIVIMMIALNKLDNNKEATVNNLIVNNQNQDKVQKVNSYNDYYGVKNAVEKYLIFLSMNNSEAVYSLLDKEYTEKNKITTENVINKIGITQKTELIVREMTYKKESDYNNIYYIKRIHL